MRGVTLECVCSGCAGISCVCKVEADTDSVPNASGGESAVHDCSTCSELVFELVAEPELVYELVSETELVFELVVDFDAESVSPQSFAQEEAAPAVEAYAGVCGSVSAGADLDCETVVIPGMQLFGHDAALKPRVQEGTVLRTAIGPFVAWAQRAPVSSGPSWLPFDPGWKLVTVRRTVPRPPVVQCVRVVRSRLLSSEPLRDVSVQPCKH